MSKAKFFSNSVMMLDHKDSEYTLSLKNTRTTTQRSFSVPMHNVGTPNLMIFVNGQLCVPDRDYIDINSSTVRFNRNIQTHEDFHAILIRTSKDVVYIGEGDMPPSESLEWEYF